MFVFVSCMSIYFWIFFVFSSLLFSPTITLAHIKIFFKRSKVYPVIYDHHFMLNSKMPFIVFCQVWFLNYAWILHKLYIIITHIQKPVTADHGCLMFSKPYNVVRISNYCVPPYSLTSTYLEEVRLISQLKMILMYCSKCQWWAVS